MEALTVRRKHDRMGLRTGLAIRPELRSSGGKVMTAIFSSSGVGTLPRRAASAVTIMKSILVVEDEPEIARVIRDYLQAAGFTVSVAADGESALQTARISRPDLVVLDLGLPGRDGLDVTRELRRTSDVPIVVVTARGDEADRIVGLELGADDYVVKPFSPKELVARVRALFRRVDGRDEPADIIRVADLEIDIPRMRVTVNGHPVELTVSEFQLLAAMAREPGRVFTRGQLLDVLHGVAFESYERAIDAHVKNLRRKIEPEPGTTRYVQTVYGVGYRFAG
jgi:two-component system alkaline phosphatase synthesis response regulator PhoP